MTDSEKKVTFNPEDTTYSDSEAESHNENENFNKFHLLNLVEDTEDLDLNDPDTDKSDDESKPEDEANRPEQSSSKSRPKNKNKKRRKKGRGTKYDAEKVEQLLNPDSSPYLPLENIEITSATELLSGSGNLSKFRLLKTNPRDLLAENELKRMFGKSVVAEEKKRGLKNFRGRDLKYTNMPKSRFVTMDTPEFHFMLPEASGPKMELDEIFNEVESNQDGELAKSPDNKRRCEKRATKFDSQSITYFKFVHDKRYQETQKLFLAAAMSGDPHSLIEVAHINPYHAETLLQISEIYKIQEDYKFASGTIERALVLFERGFHPKFDIYSANCRLSYQRPENRTFFISLFRHIIYCGRRGLRRTPLEYAKLLLSLDPDNDPLFVVLLIDYFAIRSEEYDFLIDFISQWKEVSELPNMCFSLALAHFLRSKKKSNNCDNSSDIDKANQLLEKALLRYPNFITALLDACSAEPSAELRKCNYFDYSVYGNKYKTVPETLDLLITIYVQRAYIVWKSKDVMNWLEQTIVHLVKHLEDKTLKDEQPIDQWINYSKPAPKTVLRHMVLSDMKMKIPPSVTHTTIIDFDPFPPRSISSYHIQIDTPESSSTLSSRLPSLFLRSLLPSFYMPNSDAGR